MAAQLEILIKAKNQASAELNKVRAELKGVESSAKSAGAGLAGSESGIAAFAKNMDRASNAARIGLGAVSQIATFAGNSLGGLSREAAQVADAVGDLATSFLLMGPVGLAITAVGLAIGGVITLLRQQADAAAAALERTRQYEAQLRATYETARAGLNELAPKEDPLQGLADSIPLAVEKLRELAQTSEEARDKLNRLLTSQAGARVLEDRIATLTLKIREINAELERSRAEGAPEMDRAGLNRKLEEAENWMRVYTNALEGARAAQAQLTAEVNNTSAALEGQAIALQIGNLNAAAAARAFGDDYADAFMRATNTGRGMNEVTERGARLQTDWASSAEMANQKAIQLAEQGLARARAAYQQLRDAVRGFVAQALVPTSVTLDDINAAMTGQYIPKWDEFRRRVEALATGTDISAFGEKFKQQLELVQGMFQNLSLDEIAIKFKDFSLFADTSKFQEMLAGGVIDLSPIVNSVNSQIDQIIGKANAMDAAFDEVWSKLSSEKKLDLARALGIETGGIKNIDSLKDDLQGKIADPAGIAKDAVNNLGGAITSIPKSITTIFTAVTDAATAAIDAFKLYLDDFIKNYGEIGVTIAVETITAPSGGTGSSEIGAGGSTAGPNTATGGGTGGGPEFFSNAGGGGTPNAAQAHNELFSSMSQSVSELNALGSALVAPAGAGAAGAPMAHQQSNVNNSYTFILPNVRTAQDADKLYREFMRRLGTQGALRSAMQI